MRIPLKYLLPLSVFLTGLLILLVETYIQKDIAYNRMASDNIKQIKIIGNRLTSRIVLEARTSGIMPERIGSLVSPYMAETLDQVDIYDENLNMLFTRSLPAHKSHAMNIDLDTSNRVKKEQFADIEYDQISQHIIGYFPIELKIRRGEVNSRNTGVIHLVFDVSRAYQETTNILINSVISNVIIIVTMVLSFSLLMYFLVFKRLNALHKATQRLSDGDFSTTVKIKGGDDELTQVIHTFNTMAHEMHEYKDSMEEKIHIALKEREEQTKILVQQSRLASMGEMIGNIAHQWRQPLNALSLLIQKLQLFSQRGKLTEEVINDNVEKAILLIDNMSTTIDDFRDFFKPDKQQELFDLKHVMHEMMSLTEANFKERNIHIIIDIDQPNCEVYGFKNEFAQVIINLLNNSKDAFEEKHITEGKIHVSGKVFKKTTVFKISDNAGGIPETILDRIFEPYYTTKEEGKGTGIGLYMSKMIVEENMHGKIQAHNTKEGVEFIMTFENHKGEII